MTDRCFNSANIYDKNALWQKDVANDLVDFAIETDQIKKIKKIIDIGCGTGFVTEKITNSEFKDVSITMLDASFDMLAESKKKFSKYKNVFYIHANFEDFAHYEHFDILFSSMAIHWFNDLKKSIEKIIKISNSAYLTILLDTSMHEVRDLLSSIISLPSMFNIQQILDDLKIQYQSYDKSIYKKMTLYDFLKEHKMNGTIANIKNNDTLQSAKIIRNHKQKLMNINYDILYLKLWK